ncbi:MAG: CehA/McbA family metallohydrolase [Planctomycetes bacterium]|nr:CehA/McbA family metallohydrolase [Planctomycetota bacterium]
MFSSSRRRWSSTLIVFFVAGLAQNLYAGELRGRVLDSATGRPLPARIYVRSAAGKWHFVKSTTKDGSAVEYRKNRGPKSVEMHTTVSAHPFRCELPPGKYTITVERGKEYLPVTQTVTVAAKPVELTFRLKRWINLAARGWYSGDTHVHRTVAELPNVMLAEDLNVALPLTHWVTRAYTPPTKGNKNSDAGTKAELIRVDKTHVIYPLNTEYEIFTVNGKRHTLGAVFVLNHKTPLPMGAPPVGPIAAAARKQGAILDLDKHSWPWSLMLVPVMNVDLFELSNNHVWRTDFYFKRWTISMKPEFMTVETDDAGMTERGWVDFGLGTYYALINCGFRMRPTAGTASGVHPVPLGFGRVYVHLKDGFGYDEWMAGLNAGRSFVTTGPMLFATFNGKPPGHTFSKLAYRNNVCKIAGTAETSRKLSIIEVIVNGEVQKRITPENRKTKSGGFVSAIDVTVKLDGSSWVAVRCFENRPNGKFRFAHTAPVYFDVKSYPLYPKRAEVRYFIRRMQEEIVRNKNTLKPDQIAEFRKALRIYRNIEKRAR